MDNIPLNIIAFGLVDRFLEPFCYGCAAYVVSFRLTKSSFAKIVAIVAGILMFLWMDDIWPKLGFQQGQVGIAAGNPNVAELLSEQPKLGAARFYSGESSGLFGLYDLDTWDILSAILFVPLGFLMGLKLSRRKWDEVQLSQESNRYQSRQSVATSPRIIQPNQMSSFQKGDNAVRIHIRPQDQVELVLSLEQVNNRLNQGKLDGDEPAWTPGLSEWTRLDSINGVVVPKPPQLKEETSPETPPTFTEKISDSSLGNDEFEPTKQSQEQQSGFKDPAGLTKWTKWFLYAQVLVAIVAIISSMLEYQLLLDFQNGVYTSQEKAAAAGEASDARQGVVGIIQFVVFVISGILILKWIYRANYNARQLGASEMIFTPGWSIGWYFIPIANLWKPYQAMKEIWKASTSPQNWSAQSIPSLLPWWWFFWIVSNIFDNASFRLAMRAEEINELIAANVVTQLADVIGIPLSLIVIAIISRVHEMQMSHACHLRSKMDPLCIF